MVIVYQFTWAFPPSFIQINHHNYAIDGHNCAISSKETSMVNIKQEM